MNWQQKKYDLVVERLRQDSISRTIQMDEMETSLANMRRNIQLVHERKGASECPFTD